MTLAEKHTSLGWLLYQYLRFRLSRRFHHVVIRGLPYLQNLPYDRPVIVFSNHINWWDGLMVFLLTRCARHKNFYCIMSDQQLAQYPYLERLGAFSIDLENPLRAAGVVRFAVKLLQKRSTLLWLFPQGEMSSPHQPLQMRTGANYLATQANGAQMLPIAFRYEFFRGNKPHALIEIGQPFSAHESSDEKIVLSSLEVSQRLNEAVVTQNLDGFVELIPPTKSPLHYLGKLRPVLERLWPKRKRQDEASGPQGEEVSLDAEESSPEAERQHAATH